MYLQDMYAKYLMEDYGSKEIFPSKSKRYRQFVTAKGNIYWLGSKGAVRVGKSLRQSRSITSISIDYVMKAISKKESRTY